MNFIRISLIWFFIAGKCKCGCTLQCEFSSLVHENLVIVTCTVKNGFKTCGKRQLRGEARSQIGKKLQQQSVFAYRNEVATKMEYENQNLGRLPNSSVLRVAKHEYKKSQYLHNDPIVALGLLKRATALGKNVIQKIGFDPFFVYFWSSHQLKVYNAKMVENDTCICIDATGKVASKIVHANKEKSKHLFLYTGTLHNSSLSVPVMRQVTESHDTASIADWLRKWLQTGARFPKEVVSVV